jgi:hypothetical protein
MRRTTIMLLALGASAIAGVAELVLDIRTPRSDLLPASALGASASLSMVEYNKKVDQFRSLGTRARVTLDPSSGEVRAELDGMLVEQWQIERQFGGMYGIFVVGAGAGAPSIFPFADVSAWTSHASPCP